MLDGWKNINYQKTINIAVKQQKLQFLESVYINCSETAENVVENLIKTLKNHNLEIENVCSVITDNCVVMKKIGSELMKKTQKPIITFGCMSHVINLIAKYVLEIPSYFEILKFCNNIVHILNNTTQYTEIVNSKNICIRKGCNTRWTSYTSLFNGIIKHKEVLKEIELIKR